MFIIKTTHTMIDRIGRTFPNGTLNGRGKSSCCLRNKITAKEIRLKTAREPTLAIKAKFLISINPARIAAKSPFNHSARLGL